MTAKLSRSIQIAAAAIITLSPAPALAQAQPDWSDFERPAASSAGDSTVVQQSAAPPDRRAPLRRRIMRQDVTMRVKTLRLDSGAKVSLVYGMPKKAKNCPAVFVLDVETNTLANSPGLLIPGMSSRQRQQMRQASYLLRSPFGSHMLGSGFAVAYVVADDLEALRSARTNDWIGIIDRVRDLRQVHDNSVFLFSTREYANLSVFLASKYNFSGFILEEPSYLLFSRETHDDVISRSAELTSEEIWSQTDPTRERRYLEVLSRISTPIMLIRNPESEAYALNDKTLIPKLYEARTYFESVEVKGPARALTTFGGEASGIIDIPPEVSYHPPTVNRWVDEIISYMKVNSTAEPVALRDPSAYRNW